MNSLCCCIRKSTSDVLQIPSPVVVGNKYASLVSSVISGLSFIYSGGTLNRPVDK